MKPNLSSFDRIFRLVLVLAAVFIGIFIFQDPFAKGAAFVVAAYLLWEGAVGYCPLHGRLGARTPSEHLSHEATYLVGLLGIQLVLAYEWFTAGFEKIISGTFPQDLAETLARFASENPYSWYKAYLLGPATDYSVLLGYTVEWSQVVIAAVLIAAVIAYLYTKNQRVRRFAACASLIVLFGGMLMNANFYLASGWMSPSSHGLNLVMFWVQGLLAYVWMMVGREKV